MTTSHLYTNYTVYWQAPAIITKNYVELIAAIRAHNNRVSQGTNISPYIDRMTRTSVDPTNSKDVGDTAVWFRVSHRGNRQRKLKFDSLPAAVEWRDKKRTEGLHVQPIRVRTVSDSYVAD